jgi:hypothetical protein
MDAQNQPQSQNDVHTNLEGEDASHVGDFLHPVRPHKVVTERSWALGKLPTPREVARMLNSLWAVPEGQHRVSLQCDDECEKTKRKKWNDESDTCNELDALVGSMHVFHRSRLTGARAVTVFTPALLFTNSGGSSSMCVYVGGGGGGGGGGDVRPANATLVVKHAKVPLRNEQRDNVAEVESERELGGKRKKPKTKPSSQHRRNVPAHEQVVFVHPRLCCVTVVPATVRSRASKTLKKRNHNIDHNFIVITTAITKLPRNQMTKVRQPTWRWGLRHLPWSSGRV